MAQSKDTLDKILADLNNEGTRIDALVALKKADDDQIKDLSDKLAAALANTNIPQDVQDEIDAIFAAAETNRQKIDDAMPPPPVETPPQSPPAAPDPTTTPASGPLLDAFRAANPAVTGDVTVQQAVTWWNTAHPGETVPA